MTGTIGAGAAGLHILRERSHELGPAGVPDEDPLAYAVSRYRRPAPRLRIGALLGRNRAASACMDLSDGLADAVRQIAGASGTGAKLDAAALPLDEGARAWFGPRLDDALMACVSGGDDYELLFASPRRFRGRLRSVQRLAAGVAITPIGEVTAAKDLVIVRDGRSEPLPQGFTHF